jgi:hypothetical protein
MKNFFRNKLASPLEGILTRRALSTGIAIFCAVYVDAYYSMLHQSWVSMTTILILQMTIRLNFQHEVQRFAVILLSVLAGTLVVLYIHPQVAAITFIFIVFIMGCAIHNYYPPHISGFSPALMVAVVFMLMLMPFVNVDDVLFARLHDVVLGGFIGIAGGLLVLPGRPDVDFRNGLLPILKGYQNYFTAIMDMVSKTAGAEQAALTSKALIESSFGGNEVYFPDWVYKRGFTASLREGHRHFLLRVEELGEILFAMNYHARFNFEADTLSVLHDPLQRCANDINQLLDELITVLEKTKLTAASSELAEDIVILENIFQDKLALPFELLETSKEQMHMLGIIYGLKDFQRVLAALEEALRGYISRKNVY